MLECISEMGLRMRTSCRFKSAVEFCDWEDSLLVGTEGEEAEVRKNSLKTSI